MTWQPPTDNIIPVARPSIKLDEKQQNCVDVLSEALEVALAGRISSVALVVCMDDGIATVMAGTNGGALNIGCDDLKLKIHAEMFGGNTKAAAKSKPSIIQVRR